MTSIMRQFCKRKICFVAAIGIFTGSALADSTPAEQAVELLARSKAVNANCNYLNAANRERLAQLVKQAQGALTARENANAAEAALKRGNDDGVAAACSTAERASLNATLSAANQAASHGIDKTCGNKSEIAAAPKPELTKKVKANGDAEAPVAPDSQTPTKLLPSHLPKQVTEQSHSLAVTKPPKHLPLHARPDDNGLQYYAQITGDYFVARRCSPGDARQLGKMYQEISVTRNDLMHNHSAIKLSMVLHRSEHTALARRCG